MQNLSGRSIMIVEDDYFAACELADHFRLARANVLGPFSTVDAAFHHAEAAELAVLDVALRDHQVFPLADWLLEAAVPFVFYSAQDAAAIPRRFAHVTHLPKPRRPIETVTQLSREFQSVTISALLPRLRLSARLILKDPLAADRLVEATLLLAVQESASLPELPSLPGWLQGLMDRALHERGSELLM